MRYRVDTRYGYVSFDKDDEDKARALFAEEGVALRVCVDLHDPGILIDGVDVSGTWANG